MSHRRLTVVLAALLALPACAVLQPDGLQPREALLSDAPPRPLERTCRVAREPQALPSADALVDSAALAAAAAELWRASGVNGHVLVGMRYDREGLNVRRDVLEHRLGDALADTLQKLVFAHRRRAEPAGGEWSVRLRLDVGETPRLRVGRTEVCAPRLRSGTETGWGNTAGAAWGDVRDAYAPPAAAEMYDPSTVWVRVALDSRGNVTEARLERSLGRRTHEMRVLNYVRTISFIPAMEDGYPVPGELSMPLRMGR
jgi:TonB family protein